MTGGPGRRRAWDEVQEWQRRHQARLDTEREAADAADPGRPTDRWRISGRPVLILRPELNPPDQEEPRG